MHMRRDKLLTEFDTASWLRGTGIGISGQRKNFEKRLNRINAAADSGGKE